MQVYSIYRASKSSMPRPDKQNPGEIVQKPETFWKYI